MTPPVQFLEKAKAATPANGIGYPVQLRATDLDQNFYYATPIIAETNDSGRRNLLTETEVSEGAFPQRKFQVELAAGANIGDLLQWDGTEWISVAGGADSQSLLIFNGSTWAAFSPPPSSGIYVLGSDNGTVQWLATEDCN
jgi:hypothetical protein